MSLAYHFTSADHWADILEAGVIRTTESNLSMTVRRAGPDVVWLLDVSDLSGLGHGLSFPDGDVVTLFDKTEVRIAVEPNPKWTKRWSDWADAQGMNDFWRRSIVNAAGGQEAADHWLVSFQPVPTYRWTAADNMKTGEALWRPAEKKEQK